MKTITQDEYWQFVGLLTLARRHRQFLDEIEKAALAIAREEPNGHVSDFIVGGYPDDDFDKLLERADITVSEGPQ